MTTARLPWLNKQEPPDEEEETPAQRCVRLGHDPAINLVGEVKCMDCGAVLNRPEEVCHS